MNGSKIRRCDEYVQKIKTTAMLKDVNILYWRYITYTNKIDSSGFSAQLYISRNFHIDFSKSICAIY